VIDALHSLEIKRRNRVYRRILPDGSQRKVPDSSTSAAVITAGTKTQSYEQICISISLRLCKLTDLRRYMQANKIQIVQLPQVLKKTVSEVLLKKFFSFLYP